MPVALRKESVDRNEQVKEITQNLLVALRKESVDRNVSIDILPKLLFVALRKESVDRNARPLRTTKHKDGRSPQGERG